MIFFPVLLFSSTRNLFSYLLMEEGLWSFTWLLSLVALLEKKGCLLSLFIMMKVETATKHRHTFDASRFSSHHQNSELSSY